MKSSNNFIKILIVTLLMASIIIGAKVIAVLQDHYLNKQAMHADSSQIASEQETLKNSSADHIRVMTRSGTEETIRLPNVQGVLTDRLVLGYYTEDYPEDISAFEAVQHHGELLDYVATFSFCLDGKGNLLADEPLVLAEDVATLALVHNFQGSWFDRDIMIELLEHNDYQENAIQNIVTKAKTLGFSGIHIDLENFGFDYQEAFTLFMQKLRKRCEVQGLSLSMAVPAKTAVTYDQWSGGFNYQALATTVDFMVLMTYDQHWFGGPPGPIASATWVEDVLNYALTQVPSEKLVLGIAGYGYDWDNNNQTKSLSMSKVEAMATERELEVYWHNEYLVPYLIYTLNDIEHEVWYENDVSLQYKLELVEAYHLRGIAFWRLGFANEDFWEVIRQAR